MSIRLSSKALKKIVAGSVTAAFFFTTVGEPFAQTSFWADRQAARTRPAPSAGDTRQLLSTISWPKESLNPILGAYRLPSTLGTVVETHTGSADAPVLIHLQDAHGLYGAQYNASKVLDGLFHAGWSGGQALPVYQEGGAGPANIDWLSAFPDDEIKEQIGLAHLRHGDITGEEYRALVSSSGTFRLMGVETKDLYKRNLAARHETAKDRAQADVHIGAIQTRLSNLKSKIYPPALLAIDRPLQAYTAQSITFIDYIQTLATLAPRAFESPDYPNLNALLRLTQLEAGLDFRGLAEERDRLVQKMASRLTTDDVKGLVAKATEVREGRRTQGEFYQALLSMADQLKQQGEDLPTRALRNYAGYLRLSDSLRHEELLTEAEQLRGRLLERYSPNDRVWRLVNLDRRVALERLLWKQEMTPDQYAAFKEQGPLDWAEVEKYVAEQESVCGLDTFRSVGGKPDTLAWTLSLPKVRAFYELAVERDIALVMNTLGDMKANGVKRGVLIAGGFHTPGLTRLFRQEGVSYAVVQPNFETGEALPSSKDLVISQTPARLAHTVREANLMVTPPAGSPGAANNPTYSYALKMVAMSAINALSKKKNEARVYLSRIREWMATSASRMNMRVISVFEIGETSETRVFVVVGQVGRSRDPVAFFYREGAGDRVPAISFQVGTKDILTTKALDLSRQLPRGFVEPGRLSAWVAGLIQDLKGVSDSSKIADIQEKAAKSLSELGVESTNLLLDFLKTADGAYSLPQSAKGDKALKAFDTALKQSVAQAPSRMRLFFENLRSRKSLGLGAIIAFISGLVGASELFLGAAGTMVASSGALLPMIVGLLLATATVGIAVGYRPVAALANGLKQKWVSIAVTPAKTQKSILPLVAGLVIGGGLFLWGLPMGILFLKDVLSPSVVDLLSPVLLILDVTSSISFLMMALVVGYKVYFSSDYKDAKWAGVAKVAAPAVAMVFTSGVLFAFFAAFAAWNLATSDAARQAALLRPVADRLNQSADALKRISPAWFGALLSGRSPPEKNRWVSLLLWTPSKLIHVAKDLAGTFKSFAFQSAIDLYAIYEGNPTKTENEMTLAEKWFREVMTTLRGASQPGSLRYAFAQGAGIVIGVGFYTQATVSRRVGLMLLSSVSSFAGTQIVGAFVWVAALGGGLGGVVMAVFFLYQSYQYYKKFGHERQGFKGINVRMVIFGLLGLAALVTSSFAFSGMGSEVLLGHFYAFNPAEGLAQYLAGVFEFDPKGHWMQFLQACVGALGPSAILGSALFGLLLTVKGMAAQTQLANAAEKKVLLSTLDRVFGWTRYALPLVRYYWKETDLEKRRAFASKTSSSILGLVSVGPEVAGAVGIAAWAGGLDAGLAPAAEVINRIEGGKGIMGLSHQLTQSVSVSLFGEADWINLHNYTVVGTGYTTQELVQMNLLLSGIHSMEAEIAAQRAEMATQGKSSQQIEGLQSKVTALRESLREIQSKSLRNSKTDSANLKKGFRGLLPMLFDILIPSAKAEEIEPAVSSAEVPGLPTPAAQSLPGPLASSLTSDQGSNQGQAVTVGSEQPVAHVKTIKGNLNLRAGPGVDSAWLASLPKGREITVLPATIGTKTPGWVLVRAVMENGKSVQGYVDARFVQFAAPSLPSSENRVPLNTGDEKPNSVAGFSVTSHYHAERGFNPETGKPYVHSGTDIACPVGTPLVAPKDLTILEAGSDGSRGHYVVVGIAGESFTFMHLNEPVQLKRGDRVPEKTIFAQTGHTGNARGNNGGDHVHVEYRDRDGQSQDPLGSPITAAFLAQGRSAKTEVASVREIPSGRVVRVTDALAKVGETTSVQVANLKSDSARIFAQEILAKFFKGDLEIAASRLQSKEIIPGGVKEILQLVGAGSGGGTVHVLTGTTLEPDQVKKKNTAELQINLLIKAVAWSDDLTNDARVRKHAAKMRDLMAEIETKVNVPGTIIDYFLDISSVDAQLKLLRDEIRKKSIQKQEIEEKIVKGQENATNLRQRFDADLNRLKISLATLEGQREEFVMKLFILVPGLWPEGTTWAQAKADAQTAKFDIDETQIETYLRNAGADNASNLRIQLAREKAALLKAAIPAHHNTDAEIKGVLGILRLVAGKATGGLSMALDAVARVTLYDPEREAKENAGVWAYARAVVEAEEIERQEKYAEELSHRERDHSLRQVASQRESVARNELELDAFRERMENGQLAYRDLLSKQKSDLETKQALERLKRESLRMVGQAAKNNFSASNVTPVDSEASVFDRVKGFFGGGILDLFRNPDAKAEMKRAEMEKENERLFAPVDIKDPTFMTAARMLLDRSHQLRQARSRVKEIQQMRAANQRSEDIKLSGYGRGTASGASRGGVGGGEFSVGFGFSKTWDPSRDIQDLQLSRQERIAELTEAEVTNRSLSSLGSQMWLLDDLLAKRTDLAKAIETYEETIRLNEGIEKGSSQDRLVRLSQARSALEDARRARDENEHRIKSVTTELERTMVVTPKDTVVFSESYRASNVFTSFPYLQYEKYITRTTEGDKVVDVLNEEGKSLLDRSGREAVEAQAHLSAMKARLPLLRAQQVEGIFVSRGETEKAAQAKALRETFERAFQQGTPANSEAIQRALQSLTALTENENMNPLPDEMLVTLLETHLVEFANLRSQAFANSQDSPEKAYEDLRELSLVALKLLAIKASMSPAFKWGSPDGMALDRLISDWDQSFMGRYDPYTSQRIALNTAESYQAGATKTGNSEPVTVNIDFISLFMGGSGTRVGTGFNPAQIPLALFKIPQKHIEEIFSWSRPIVDKALKSDPEGFGKFLSKWIPGYQSSVLRDRSIAAQLRLAWIEIITAEQRWKDVINAQDSFITQLVLAQKMQKLAQAKVTLLEQIEPESAGHLPETDLRNAENNAALLIARRELGEYNKRVFDLKIALLALGIDPNNLPYVNEEVTRMDRVTFSYADLASKDAVESKLAVYRAMFAREEFRSAEIARGMPQMPLSVGITGDGERKGAFVSVDLLDPDLVVLKSDVDAALDRVKVADLLISETKAGQAGRINGDMQAYFTGVVRREMSKEIHDIFVRRMNWLERAGYRGQEERNAVSILDFQAIKGIEQGGAGAADALYRIRTIFGQTNLGLSVDLPNPMDILAIGKATKAVFSRLPVATPGVTAIFGGNPGQFSEQARLKVKENEEESEKTKVLLPKINLSAFSEPINGRTLTLSVRWNLWGSGGTERRAIIENEKKEIQAYLEEKQRVHQAFVEQNESDMARSIAKISDINREIAELTERARAQGLQKDYINEKIQMGDVASYQARLAELVATRAYEFWMLALKYQSTADILKVYGQEIPPLDDVLRDAGIGTIPEGSRSFYEEFTSGPLAETPRPLPVRRDSSKEWNAAQVRAQAPLYKPAKVEQNPEPTVSSVLNVLGQRVDVPLSHLSFRGPSWFEKTTTQMAEAIGMHLDDSRLLNSSDFAVFVDGIFDNYRFPKTPQFMARFQSAFIAVNREFKDLTDSSEMPNSFAKYTEQHFKERFPFHALLTADTETSMRMDKNFHKKFALALFLASEMTNYPDRDNPKWMELVIKDISQNIRLGNRERKGYRLTAKEKEVYFARKRDFSAAMDRALLMPFFSDGKGVAHASEVSQQYNAAAHQGLQRLFPELSRWTERLNEEKSERGGENRNNGQGSSFSRYGNLDEESLIASMTAIAVSNGWSPETLKGYLFFLAESIAPQVGRYTKGATIRDYAQQPDADLLRALLQDYHQSSEKEPENKAIQEDKIEFLSESEKAKFIIATSFIWAGEYFKAMKIDPARAVKDPEAKERIARDFTQTMDRMIALRGMPEVSEIIKRQGAAIEGRIYWFSTDVLGILTALSIDWVREGWTGKEMSAHLRNVLVLSSDPYLSKLQKYQDQMGNPLRLNLKTKDPAERVAIWGTLSGMARTIERLDDSLDLAPEKMGETLDDLVAIRLALVTERNGLIEKARNLEALANRPGLNPLVQEAYAKGALRLRENAQSYHWDIGQDAYIYRLSRNLVPEQPFHLPKDKPRREALAELVSDYVAAKERHVLAGTKVLGEFQRYLDDPAQMPKWMSRENLPIYIENIAGNPSRGIKGLMDQNVGSSTAMYFASAFKQLRGPILNQDTENMFYLQSIYMSTHKDEKGAPQRLQEGEIAPYLDNIRRGSFSRDQTGRVFFYDGWLSNRIKNELPQIMADELSVLRKKEITKEERELIRREMFQLKGPEAIGLAFYLVRQQDSFSPGVGMAFPEVDQYFTRWLKDSGFILAQAWNSSGERPYIMPFQILSSNLNMFRDGRQEISSHQKFLLTKKFKGVFRTDPGLMDLGERGNQIRSLRSHYFTMLGEPLTVERETILAERMNKIEQNMAGATRQEIETAQMDYLAKLRTLREVMSDTMGRNMRPQSGEPLVETLDRAWWSLSTKLTDILIAETSGWESRKADVRRVREESQAIEETLSEARRAVAIHRSERAPKNEAELSDPARARAWQGRLAMRMPLMSGDVDTYKILYRQGYSEDEIVTRFHVLPSLVIRAFNEATGRNIDMEDLQQKGRVMAESDILFEQWGMLSVPSESAEANAVLGRTPISIRNANGVRSLRTVSEGLDWAFDRLKRKYARAENVRKEFKDYKIQFDENKARHEARLNSQSNSIAHNATEGAVSDRLLADWLSVAKAFDATADDLHISFDKRMSLYYADLLLRLGLAEFYPREVEQNERIRESGGRSVEWVKNREAAERQLGWIFSAVPIRRPNEHIGDIGIVKDKLSGDWLRGAHLEEKLKDQLSSDPNRRAEILNHLADRMTVLGLEETDLVFLAQRADALIGKLIEPTQRAEEQKSKFEYSAGPQSPLSRLEALLTVDELETNPQRQIKLLPLLFEDYDYLSPTKTESQKKAAGKEIQRFFEKIGAIIYGANRMIELKRFETLGYLRPSPSWSRWLTGDNKRMPSPYGNFMVAAFSISLALFFKKILIGRFVEPLKGLGLFQNKRSLHNFAPNRLYPWKWSAFEFLANFVTFFFAVWSFATWNHLPEAFTWASGILLLSVWTYLDRGIRFPQLYLIFALFGGLLTLSLSASLWGWALQPFLGPMVDVGGMLGSLMMTIGDGLTGLVGKNPIYLGVLSVLSVIFISHLVLKSSFFAKQSGTPSGVLESRTLGDTLVKRGDFDVDFTLPRRSSRLGRPETLDSLLVKIGALKPGQVMPVLTPFMPQGNTREEVMEKVEEVLEIKAQELRNNEDNAHVSILLLNHSNFEFKGLPNGEFFKEVERIIKEKGYYEEFAYTDEKGVHHDGSERFITIAMPPGRKPEVFVRALKLMEYGEDGGPGAMFGQKEYESILAEAREEVSSYLDRMGYPALNPESLLNLTDLSRVFAPFNAYIDGNWGDITDWLRGVKQKQLDARRDSLRNSLRGYGISDGLADSLDAAEFESEWKRLYDEAKPNGISYAKLTKILLKNISQSRKEQQSAFRRILAQYIEKDSVAKEIALQLSLTSIDHFTLEETNDVFNTSGLDDETQREILERVADIRAEIMDPPLWQPVRTEVGGKGIWYGPLHLVMERVRAVNQGKMAEVIGEMGRSAGIGLNLNPATIAELVNTFQTSLGDAPLTLALAKHLISTDDKKTLDGYWGQIQDKFKEIVDSAVGVLNFSMNLQEASKEIKDLAQVFIGGLAAGNIEESRVYFMLKLHGIAKARGMKMTKNELMEVAKKIEALYENKKVELAEKFNNTGSLSQSIPGIFAHLSGKDDNTAIELLYKNSALELLYKSSGVISDESLKAIEAARERLKVELDVYFSSPYMDDTPMFTGIFTNGGYVRWNEAKAAWQKGQKEVLSDPKEVGANIVLGRLMPPEKKPGELEQRAPIFIVVDDTNKTAQAGGIYQAGVIDENVREDGFRKVRDALKSVLPMNEFDDEFIERIREFPPIILKAPELNELTLKERDLLLWEVKIALRNAGQYFLHQARTGYAARLDQATHEQTFWEYDGNLMHNALFPIQGDLFRTSAGGRIFGKYGGKTRTYLQAHSYFPGFPFGAYYTRTVLFSGIGLGRLRVFQGNHDHINQKAINGLSNWGKQVLNSEDEINSETPEDAEQIFALMKKLVATSVFSFFQWVFRGRGGSYEAYRYLEPIFDKMRLSMRPPLPHRTSVLIIFGIRILIYDDRPLGVTFELYRGVQKWISGNDVLNEFGRFIGRSLFQGLHGRSTNNGVLRGLISGPMFLMGMFTGLVFMWVLPGQVEIARVAAAVFLGWLTMFGLVVVMKFLGPLVESFIHPWPTFTRNRFVQRHMEWYYQIESPSKRWFALQMIRFVWTVPALFTFLVWKVPLVIDEIGRSNSIYMAYPFPGMGAVGRGLLNVKNMKKHGLMGANAPNMLETQSDVFSKTLSALSSSTAVAMTLFGMYMAAFLPIGTFGQALIGLFGFIMAGTLVYARFISPSSDWRSTLQINQKKHLKAYEEAKLRGVDFSSPAGRDIKARSKIALWAKIRYSLTTGLSILGIASIGLFFLLPGFSLPRDWLVWGLLVILSWQVAPFSAHFASVHFDAAWRDLTSASFSQKALKLRRFTWALGRLRPVDRIVLGKLGSLNDDQSIADRLASLTEGEALRALNDVLKSENLAKNIPIEGLALPKAIIELAKKEFPTDNERQQINKAILQELYPEAINPTYRLFGLIPMAITPKLIPIIKWVNGVATILAAIVVHLPVFDPIFGLWKEEIVKLPVAIASMVAGADGTTGIFAIFLNQDPLFLSVHTAILMGLVIQIFWGVSSVLVHTVYLGIKAINLEDGGPLGGLKNAVLGLKRVFARPGGVLTGILALSALFYSSNPFAATLAGSVTTSFVLATIGPWMLVPVMLFPVLLVGVYRRQVSVLGASWVGSISERLDQVQNFFKSLTGSIVPLGANLAEKILKSPAAMATVVVGLASLAGAAGFHLMGSTAGTSGVASAAGVPALFVMALSATSVGAGSSAVFTRWELPSFLEPLRRAGGFLATPGGPSIEKKGDALVVDMRTGTMDSGVGEILLRRLDSIGTRSMDDPDGKVHVEFVVGKTPTPEDVNRITIAFRRLALSSDLSQSAIGKISIGVVAQETEGLKARLNDLSAFHINVVAPATAVEFWADLGMPLTVFAAKLLADLTRVEVDIIYTGAAAQAVEALSNGGIKADEKGHVRLKALATPLQVIDQDNRKIQTFNQQA